MKTESTLSIFPAMCEQQCNDLKEILQAIDDFGSTVFALSSNSAQGLTCFIDERDKVRKFIMDSAKNYRYVME